MFRKSTIEQVNSPKQLNEYIRVTGISVWAILIGILLFIVGFGIWIFCGKVETDVSAVAQVKNGNATCYILRSEAKGIRKDMPIRINENTGRIKAVSDKTVFASSFSNSAVMRQGGYTDEDLLCVATANIDVPDGIYSSHIVTESVHPISLILN